jgi:hypothetical protein
MRAKSRDVFNNQAVQKSSRDFEIDGGKSPQ